MQKERGNRAPRARGKMALVETSGLWQEGKQQHTEARGEAVTGVGQGRPFSVMMCQSS